MCIPTSIPSIRRLSSNDVKTHKETQKDGARLHNNLGKESSKDKDKPEFKNKPRKRQHSNSSG
jgi:hypothetical protein